MLVKSQSHTFKFLLMKKLIFILLFFCASLIAKTQDPLNKLYNSNFGLSSNIVYDIITDENGFIWLAHNKGISRFNGKSFDNYFTHGEQGNAVSNLMCYKNNFYCQDFNGNFYTLQNKKLIKVAEIPSSGNFYLSGIINGNLIQTGINYYGVYNIESKKYKKVFVNDTFGITACFFNDSFAISGYKLIALNNLKNIYNKPTAFIKNNLSYKYLLKRNNQFIACSGLNYPYLYDAQTQKSIESNLSKNLFINSAFLVDNEIWICTTTGAFCLDENFKIKYSTIALFKDQSISKVCKDEEGGYWFSTLQNGVLYVPNLNNKTLYNEYTITSINKGKYLLAGSSNNSLINITQNKTQIIGRKHNVDKIKYDINTNLTALISDNLYVFEDNKLLLKSNIAIKDIFFVDKDLWFLSTSNGEFVYASNKEKIPKFLKPLPSSSNDIYSINNENRSKSIVWNKSNQNLYYSNSKGLFMQNKNGIKEIKFNNQSIFTQHLFLINNTIVATTSNSFYSIKYDSVDKYVNYNNSNKSQIQSSFLWNNLVYFSFNNNIYSINELLQPIKIWKNNGNLSSEITCFTLDENNIYIALEKGLAKVNLKQKNNLKTYKPIIFLNKFFENNIEKPFTNNIQLNENENNLGFEFASNSYASLDSFRIYYQLNNDDWVLMQQNNKNYQVLFNKISPGKYNLKIKGIDNNQKQTNELSFNFTINKPFYKTTWFIIIISFIIISLVILYYSNRIKQQKENNKLAVQKNDLEKELQNSLMASIKSQMNPHFLFNALNTIQSYIYTNEKENATLYLSKFSKLTRKILEQSNYEEITLEEELESLRLYVDLENMRFDNALNINIHLDDSLNISQVYLPSMLIQPYVENAIKHGLLHKKGYKELNISFLKNNQNLDIKIDDNGVGRKQSKIINERKNNNHQSFAMQANKKRLEILQVNKNNHINFSILDKIDVDQNSLGTTVLLQLPYKTK